MDGHPRIQDKGDTMADPATIADPPPALAGGSCPRPHPQQLRTA